MPLRRQEIRVEKNVTLRNSLNWIAFDNFKGPPLTLEDAKAIFSGSDFKPNRIYTIEIGNRKQRLRKAKSQLFAALQNGELKSYGRFSDQLADNSVVNNWREQTYTGHTDARDEIPADFWELEGVDWEGNRTKTPNGEFVDIILIREEVLATWPLEETQSEEEPVSSGEKSEAKSGQKRGRKRKFDEEEFLGLCVWEAGINEIPETQATFVRQMELLLAVVWGDDQVPGETWLKGRISQIYSLKKKYDDGRRELLRE